VAIVDVAIVQPAGELLVTIDVEVHVPWFVTNRETDCR
jgi:hypothetical protein